VSGEAWLAGLPALLASLAADWSVTVGAGLDGGSTSYVAEAVTHGRDERSALRWLATAVGACCQVVYLPVDKDVQRARIAHRQATAPHTTFPMSEADIDRWREQFQVPDDAELDGGDIPGPPPYWPGWPEWAADRWPPLASSDASEPPGADAVSGPQDGYAEPIMDGWEAGTTFPRARPSVCAA
jgi:hypothetical protein